MADPVTKSALSARARFGGLTYKDARAEAKRSGGVPVCYKIYNFPDIEWGVAVGMRGTRKGLSVLFSDGGTNPAEECFFSEAQCLKYHGLPSRDYAGPVKELAQQAAALEVALRDLADKMGRS